MFFINFAKNNVEQKQHKIQKYYGYRKTIQGHTPSKRVC